MADTGIQAQVNEVLALLERARALFGADPVAPPAHIAPDPDVARPQVR